MKGIPDGKSPDSVPIGKVFGEKSFRSPLTCRGNDHRVPKRVFVLLMEGNRFKDNISGYKKGSPSCLLEIRPISLSPK